MSRIIPIEKIEVDNEKIVLIVRERIFTIWYKYFPEFLDAPLRCLFDAEFSSWSMTTDSDEVLWHDEDSFHWREIEMDIHAINLVDQSLNEGRGKNRPAPFTTKIEYASWTARGRGKI